MQMKLTLFQEKPPAVRIVKKQTLEALKEVGYSDKESTQVSGSPIYILLYYLKTEDMY